MRMKQLEYVRGRTRVCWEIGRRGTTVRTRSWGARRDEHVRELTHDSVEAAKHTQKRLVEEQLERGFVEPGPKAAKQRSAHEEVNGPKAIAAMKKAIGANAVPSLRAAGFKGSFPVFHRREDDRHAVVWFEWGRAGGHVVVGLAALPPRKGSTPRQDRNRALNVRNKQRKYLSELLSGTRRKLLFFDEARRRWKGAWSDELARFLAERLADEGARWLESPARRPKRKKPLER